MNKDIEIGCAQHQGKRENQEDSFAFSNLSDRFFVRHGGVLAIVADGMGGLEEGEEASSLAVNTFLKDYMAKRANEGIPQTIQRALESANKAVLSMAEQKGRLGDIGTTLTAAVIHEKRLYWVSVGDSFIYLLRSGELCKITQEHTHLQSLYKRVASGEMTKEAAEADEHGDALTSFIGIPHLTEIDLSQRHIRLQEGDTVIICSDGLYNTLKEEEIRDIASDNINADKIAKKLISEAVKRDRQYQDNITTLVLKIPEKVSNTTSNTTSNTKSSKRPIKWFRFIGVAIIIILLLAFIYLNYGNKIFGSKQPAQRVVEPPEQSKQMEIKKPIETKKPMETEKYDDSKKVGAGQ